MAKVLIIEDDQEVRELLDIFLSKNGFIVIPTSGGKGGIDLARQHHPDLVLLDANLPDLDGIDVLKEIRNFDKSAKVVMLSGLNTEELEEEALRAGASCVLSKSVGIEEIVREVTDMVC